MGLDLVVAEFVATVRRAGIPLSPVEAIDAQRAAMAVGLARRGDLRDALRAVMVKDPDAGAAFDRAFAAFWTASGTGQGSLYDRLASQGFSPEEVEALRRLIAAAEAAGASGLGAVAAGGAQTDNLLMMAGRAAGVERMQTPLQIGFFTARVLEHAGERRMGSQLGAMRAALRDALGARGDAVADALEAELAAFRRAARTFVADELARRSTALYDQLRRQRLEERAFTQLAPDEMARVETEVRRLADRLRGALAVRRKRRRRGTLDVRRTLRRAHRTGGLPFAPVFRRRRRDRPKLVVLCDVSDSVRFAARFLLVLVYSMQEVFARTRSFVFVSDVGETTDLFKAHPPERAVQLAYGGSAVSVAANSNYGSAFGQFASRHLDAIDRRTTVIVIGDGRTNYLDPNPRAFVQIARRAQRVVWLNPEAPGSWGFGDSAMNAYLPHVSEAHTVHSLETLREAIDRVARAWG